MKLAALFLTILASVLSAFAAEPSPAQRPANILLILADDLGYGEVSCYNDRAKVSTPNIDCLAREGMRFTDAHSPATVCTPTRYSLMTGQMVFRVPRGGTVFTGVGGPSLIAPGRLAAPTCGSSGRARPTLISATWLWQDHGPDRQRLCRSNGGVGQVMKPPAARATN